MGNADNKEGKEKRKEHWEMKRKERLGNSDNKKGKRQEK